MVESGEQQAGFEKLATTRDVADALGLRLDFLTYLVYALPDVKQYRSFEIFRRSGDPRTIHAPIKPIKLAQQRLLALLTPAYKPKRPVHSYVAGRSIVSNARVHRRQRWVLRIDLQDFFPSIHGGRVRGVFLAPPFSFSPDVSTLLSKLCCHRAAQRQTPSQRERAPRTTRTCPRSLWRKRQFSSPLLATLPMPPETHTRDAQAPVSGRKRDSLRGGSLPRCRTRHPASRGTTPLQDQGDSL